MALILWRSSIEISNLTPFIHYALMAPARKRARVGLLLLRTAGPFSTAWGPKMQISTSENRVIELSNDEKLRLVMAARIAASKLLRNGVAS